MKAAGSTLSPAVLGIFRVLYTVQFSMSVAVTFEL
jgi:hypothetical protein